MLFYTECVFLAKFSLQMDLWLLLFGSNFLQSYKVSGTQDPYKTGFNLVSNTYYENLFLYTWVDVLCMLVILMHEYYLIRIGLDKLTEPQIESLHAGKIRRFVEEGNCLLSFSDVPEDSERRYWLWISEFSDFLARLLPNNKEEKPGSDFYTPIIIVQLLTLVVIFCAFTGMDGEQQDIAQSFSANQFSGEMVVAIMCQIGLILLDRYLYLTATSQSLMRVDEEMQINMIAVEHKIGWSLSAVIKIIMHFVLTLGVHYLVFWRFPIQANLILARSEACSDLHSKQYSDINKCNNFQINPALQIFYLLYCCYFVFCTLQMRTGTPSFRKGSMPLTHSDSAPSSLLFRVYMGLPFIFELRTMMDWAFTKTALDFWQWLKFEDIYAQLYITKVLQRQYALRPKGEEMSIISKLIFGFCGLLTLFFIILAPLIIFSTLNPILETNPVTGMSVDIGLMIDHSRYYQLFMASRVADVRALTSSEYVSMKLDEVIEIAPTERSLIQLIQMPTSSDSVWDITPLSRAQLATTLLHNSALPSSQRHYISLSMTYTFFRAVGTT